MTKTEKTFETIKDVLALVCTITIMGLVYVIL